MSKKAKSLALYGFIGAVFLIGFSILVLNHYWTALGVNPKTEALPQITKDYEEFKDYTTLLLALISAAGTLLSSLLIILFYDAWKIQKHYDFNKETFDIILKNVGETYYEIVQINSRINRTYTSIVDELIIIKDLDDLIPNYDPKLLREVYSQLDRYFALNNDDSILEIFRRYENSYMLLKKLNFKLISIYQEYYRKIDQATLYTAPIGYSTRPYININYYINEINQFRDLYERQNPLIYYGNRTNVDQIETNMNYLDADNCLKDTYKELVTAITKKLNLH